MKYMLHFGPDAIHIDMTGHFTFSDSHSFHKMMKVIGQNSSRSRVLLNVKDLQSMDSTGLRLMMMVHDYAKKVHCNLIFKDAQGDILSRLNEAARYNHLSIAA